jgi:hypothetical protein
MNRANIDSVLNFDLCDPQKVGQIKNRVRCHVSLLDVPIITIWSSGVIALCWFSNMATGGHI